MKVPWPLVQREKNNKLLRKYNHSIITHTHTHKYIQANFVKDDGTLLVFFLNFIFSRLLNIVKGYKW